MKTTDLTTILTITGSDNSGWSGLQLDVKTINEMGAHALTSASCIVMQDNEGIKHIYDFPPDLLQKQINDIITGFYPKAVKVGLLRSPEAVRIVRNEIIGCRNIIVAPGILSSNDTQLIDDDTVIAIRKQLIPEATVLILRCNEAEKILGTSISTNDEMMLAARTLREMGADYVMLRGGETSKGRLTALLLSHNQHQFFSSYNVEGWQQHGVGGAIATAIATRMAMGDDVPAAIKNAHEYVHSQVVYSLKDSIHNPRTADIYNQFMSLLAEHYSTAHEVQFYSDKLAITSRYLSQSTEKVIGKSPKRIITDYLMNEARQLLLCSRLTIQEISIRLGFNSQASFNTFFRKHESTTPSDFRTT